MLPHLLPNPSFHIFLFLINFERNLKGNGINEKISINHFIYSEFIFTI